MRAPSLPSLSLSLKMGQIERREITKKRKSSLTRAKRAEERERERERKKERDGIGSVERSRQRPV